MSDHIIKMHRIKDLLDINNIPINTVAYLLPKEDWKEYRNTLISHGVPGSVLASEDEPTDFWYYGMEVKIK
jgi:hypothetical protein